MKTFSLKALLLFTFALACFMAGTHCDLKFFLPTSKSSILEHELDAALEQKPTNYSDGYSKQLELEYLRLLKLTSDAELQKRFVVLRLHEKAGALMTKIDRFPNTPLNHQPIAYTSMQCPLIPLTPERASVLRQGWARTREIVEMIKELDTNSPTIEMFRNFELKQQNRYSKLGYTIAE